MTDTTTGTDEAGAIPRWQTLAAALFFAVVFVVFRWDAVQRIQALFIADSAEYLMLAQGMITGNEVPVAPLRSNFFSLFLYVPLFLRDLFVGEDTPYDSSIARIVPLGFHLLACLGAWRLGRIAVGGGAGFLAAVVVAVLPEFGFWSTDYLTDGPAGACIVWGLVFWLEGRFAMSGVVLGLSVLLRYQSLITLAAFLPLPLIARRPRELGRFLLGGLGPVALLGALDAIAWGRPFQSLWNFATKQLITFVPQDSLDVFVAEAVEFEIVRGKEYYFTSAPESLTWPLAVAFAALLLARWRFKDRRAADIGAWVVLFTVVVLSAQWYKELRYLLAIMPIVAALGAASVVAIGGMLAGWVPFLRSAGTGPLRPVTLGLLAGFFAWHCWEDQAARDYDRFGAVVAAADTIPRAESRTVLGTSTLWLLVPEQPVLAFKPGTWFSRDLEMVNAGGELSRFAGKPPESLNFGAIAGIVRSMDYLLAFDVRARNGDELWKLLNWHFVVEDAFTVRSDPRRPVYRLRRAADTEEGRLGFWSYSSDAAPGVEPLYQFHSGLALLEVTATEMPSSPGVLRVDLTWQVALEPTQVYLGYVIFGQWTTEGPIELGMDRFRLLQPKPDGPNGVVQTHRIHRYVPLPNRRWDLPLRMEIQLHALDEQGKPTGAGALVPESAAAGRSTSGKLLVTVPVSTAH